MRYRVDYDPKLGFGMSASKDVDANSIEDALKKVFKQSGIPKSNPPEEWQVCVTPKGENSKYSTFKW